MSDKLMVLDGYLIRKAVKDDCKSILGLIKVILDSIYKKNIALKIWDVD